MNEKKNSKDIHTSQVRVRAYEVDALGAVFFACYQKWFDSIALIDFFRKKEIDWMHNPFFMASISFEYKLPLKVEDLVDLTIESIELGNKSFTVHCGIYVNESGRMAARGSAVYVFIDSNTGKSISIPSDIREKLYESIS